MDQYTPDPTKGDSNGRQPIRVLYCVPDNRFGGPHRLAQSIAQRLRLDRVETLFLFAQKTPDLWRPEGFEAFWCKRIQCFSRHHPMLNFVLFCCMLPHNLAKIRGLIRSRDISIVHVDGAMNFVPALAARWTGVPIVWHYNDHPPGPIKWMLEALMARLASRVIVQGEGLRQSRTAGNRRLRDKTCVLYSAVDTSRLVPEAYNAADRARIRAELGIPTDCVLIGAVGNLNRFKGYTHFLQAAGRVKSRREDARFLVVGRKLDTDRAYWEQLQQLTAELGLSNSVTFAGFHTDVPGILSALDVFVLPSILESCPVALLEAMAMKKPVVATDVGAVREVVDHGRTGLVVPPGDAGALAEAVLTLLASPKEKVRGMTEQARKTVEGRFAVDTIASQQFGVYESLHRPHRRHV
jgi:glycosyltransferase involved in cell wall biosynthesis